MTEFEKLLKEYREQDDPAYPTSEEVKLKWLYNAALEAAAGKAESIEGPWADLEWNQASRDITAAIRGMKG